MRWIRTTPYGAIMRPYSDDKWTLNTSANLLQPPDAALISAIKRQAMLRPTVEDNPHFDGGNTASISPTNPSSANNLTSTLPADPVTKQKKYQITYPFWEAVGPWDVDNDNDGVRDSVWVDLGDPVLTNRGRHALQSALCVSGRRSG